MRITKFAELTPPLLERHMTGSPTFPHHRQSQGFQTFLRTYRVHMAKLVDFSGASTLRRMVIRIVHMDPDLLLEKVQFIIIIISDIVYFHQ